MSINAWGSDDPAEVAKGGTGDATLTDHGVLLGSGTSPVTVTSAPTNGQLLIGSTGVDPAVAAPTGDTNEIAIGTGAGTLSVGIADDPVFPGNASVTITTGTTAQEPAAVNGMMRYDTDTDKLRGVENSAWVDIVTGSGGGAYTYITSTLITSSTATLSFTDTSISTYEVFYVVFHFVPASDTYLLIRLSNDNGSSYHSSGYIDVGMSGTTGFSGNTDTSAIVIPSTTAFSSTSLNGVTGSFTIQNMLSASLKTNISGVANYYSSTNVASQSVFGGTYNTAEANDAIQFLMNSGNIATAQVHLYGLATS